MNGSIRSPLKDFTNQILSGVGDNKSAKKATSSGRELSQLDSSADNDIRKVERSDKKDSSYQDTTPTRGGSGGGGGDIDLESESTGEEYESAGETTPQRRYEKKPLNLTILAETLAEVHLSTPSSSIRQLTTFPFSPIVGSDVSLSDEDTTCSFSARQSGFKKDLSSIFEEGSVTLRKEDCLSPANVFDGEPTLHECSESLATECTPNKNAARILLNSDNIEIDEQISHPEKSTSENDLNQSSTERENQSSSSDNTLSACDSSLLVVEYSAISQSFNITSRESLKSVCLDEQLKKHVEGEERKNNDTGHSEVRNTSEAILKCAEEAIPDEKLKKVVEKEEEERTENLYHTDIQGEESKKTCVSESLNTVCVDLAVPNDELKEVVVVEEEGRTENVSQQEIREEEPNETIKNTELSLSELHNTSKSLSLVAEGSSVTVNIIDFEKVIPDEELKKAEGKITDNLSQKDICKESLILESSLSEDLNPFQSPSLLVEGSNDAVNENICGKTVTGVAVEEAIPQEKLKKTFEEKEKSENLFQTDIHKEGSKETLKFSVSSSSEIHNISKSPSLFITDAINDKSIHSRSLKSCDVEDEAIHEEELKKNFEGEERNICEEESDETLKFTFSDLRKGHPSSRPPLLIAQDSNDSVNDNFCDSRSLKGVDIEKPIVDKELKKNVEEEDRTTNVSQRDTCEDESNETLKFAESNLSELHNTSKTLVVEDSTVEATEKDISLRKSLKSVGVENLKIHIEEEEEVKSKESLKPPELYEAGLNEPWTPNSFSSIRVETGSCPSVASTPDHRLSSVAGDTPSSTPSGKVHCGKKSLDFTDIVSPYHKRRQSLSMLQGDIEGSPNKRVAFDQDLETTSVPKSEIEWITDIETYKLNSHFGKDLSLKENAQDSITAEKEVSEDYGRPLTLEIPSVELPNSREEGDERFIVRTPEVIKSIADDLNCITDTPAVTPDSIESHRFLVRTPEVISSIEDNNSSPVISKVEKNFSNGEEIIVSDLPGEIIFEVGHKDQSRNFSDESELFSVVPGEDFLIGSPSKIVNGETSCTQIDTEQSVDGIEKIIEPYLNSEELLQNNSYQEEFVDFDESKFTIVEICVGGLTPDDFLKQVAVYESVTEFSANGETYVAKVEENPIGVEKTSVITIEEQKNLTVESVEDCETILKKNLEAEKFLKDDEVKLSNLSTIEQSIEKVSHEYQFKIAAENLIEKSGNIDNIGNILTGEEENLEETGVDRVGNVSDTESPVEQQVEVVTEGSHSKQQSGVDGLVEAACSVDTGQRYNQQIVLGNNSVNEDFIKDELHESGSVHLDEEVTPEAHSNKSNSLSVSRGAILPNASATNFLDDSSLIKFTPSPVKTEGSNRKIKSSPKSIPLPSGGAKEDPNPLMIRSSERTPHEPGKLSMMDSLQKSINKLDDLTKLSDERKSYEDLLDRCSEQERLLGFDDTLREEADKLIQELANASSETTEEEEDLDGAGALPSSAYQPCDGSFTSDLNRSEAGPVTADQDITPKDGVFQEASSFDFDYLSQIGGNKGARNLARESLFLKFDPLAANLTPEGGRMRQTDSDASLAATTPGLSSSASEDKLVSLTPAPSASHTLDMSPTSTSLSTIPNCSPSPQTPRTKVPPSSVGSVTPTLRHEILSKEISKLQDLMLQQDLVYQEQLQAQTEEVEDLRARLAELETKRDQGDVEDRLIQTEARVRGLEKELAESTASNKQLRIIIDEYEKTCVQFVSDRDAVGKKADVEIATITKEKEEALQHLQNMEIAFNDIHQKYEKCKEVIEYFKKNEEEYKRCIEVNNDTIKKEEEKFNLLKEHAKQKFEEAIIEITEMRKAHQAELAKKKAMQRKVEITCQSLEESLAQKTREVEELSKICDELIKKVEGR